ncbi:MAG: MMPL family transporter, partial [Patulibacter sp.]|nr:MMPL family transporter [Patulibacter sp.]
MSKHPPVLPSAPPPGGIARVVHAMAKVAARWPKLTIALWVALIVACVAGGAVTGSKSIVGDGGTSESAVADARVDASGLNGPSTDRVLVRSSSRATTDRVAADLQRRIAALPIVSGVASALPGGGSVEQMRTADGRGVLLAASLRDPHRTAADQAKPITQLLDRARAAHPEVTLTESADGAVDAAVDDVVAADLQRAERLSVPLTLLILVLAFGALVAAIVPLVLGVTAVAGALGALGVISQAVPNSDSTGSLVVLIGLAVGVDYSLFYVRREREERRRGLGEGAALAAASASVGRAILVSGCTVMVALAGLLLTGNAVFTSMGVGTITVVAIALLGSLTVLPAMLTLLGDRVEAGRLGLPGAKRRRARREQTRRDAVVVRAAREAVDARHPASGVGIADPHPASRRGRRAGRERRGAWAVIADRVTRAPRTSLAAALLVLLALAVPATTMTLGQGGIESLPKGVPAIDAERTIDQAFPGSGDEADFVVSGARLGSAPALHGLHALGARAAKVTGGGGQVPVEVSRDGRTAIVRVPLPDHGPSANANAIKALRAQVSPLATQLVPGAAVARITGDAAAGLDFATQVKHAMPLVGWSVTKGALNALI